MMDLYFFQIFQVTLPWQPNNVAKMLSTSTDTTCIVALVLENELQYQLCALTADMMGLHHLKIWWTFAGNSRDDRAYLCMSCMTRPTRNSAIAERPRDALVSRNSATTKHPIWVMVISCGIICVILRLAVLIQYRSVADTHTRTHRERNGQTCDDGIYRA